MRTRVGLVVATSLLFVMGSSAGAEVPSSRTTSRPVDRVLADLPPIGTHRDVRTTIPSRADRPFGVTDVESGVRLSARLVSARPIDAVADGDRTEYRGALGPGTTLVLRTEPRGLEDLIEMTTAPLDEQITYAVETEGAAGVRLVGRTLELLDAGGVPRVRMAPPWLVDASGSRIEVDVRVSGCRYDTDPRAPFGRPVVAPAGTCLVTLDWSRAGARYPIVLDPIWSATDSLATARREMAIGYLPSAGDVVVAGGIGSTSMTTVDALSSVEIFDVASETFAAGMPLSTARARPSFVVLVDERLLVMGGAGSGVGTVATGAEIYDPTLGAWTAAASPTTSRVWSEAVRLASGRVLLAGGKPDQYFSTTTTASAELYDPVSNTWSSAGDMTAVRYGNFALEVLGNGRVLMAGGFVGVGSTPTSTSIYDPVTNLWSAGAPMTLGRGTGLHTRLLSGDVLLAGGSTETATTATTEIYRVASNTWEAGGDIGAPVDYRTTGAVVRGDGFVIAPAGIGTRGLYSESFDPSARTWSIGCDPSRAYLVAVGAVLLPGDRMLVVGGQNAAGLRAEAWLSGGAPPACDDGNPCTTDRCDVALGCVSTDNTDACDDGDVCTASDVCGAGVCAGTTIAGCGVDAGEPNAGEPDAGEPDAGEADAGEADAGASDGGAPDASTPDTGRADAGASDSGVPPRDAGMDAGPVVVSSGGCGCRATSSPRAPQALGLMLVAAVLMLRRRG
jgi:MYXO-CTERM domain-containing protein